MEFLDIIKNRKKIIKFSPTPISESILHEILEAGHLVHSSQVDYKWYFGIITDNKLKDELANAAGGQNWISSAPVIIAYCSYFKPKSSNMMHNIRIGKNVNNYYSDYEENKNSTSFWDSNNPLIPGEHIVLAAINHGLNACWVDTIDTLKASEILNLPYDLKCLFLMPIGYASQTSKSSPRKSYKDIIFYNKWK